MKRPAQNKADNSAANRKPNAVSLMKSSVDNPIAERTITDGNRSRYSLRRK